MQNQCKFNLLLLVFCALLLSFASKAQEKEASDLVKLSGSLSLNTIFYKMDSINGRRPDFSFAITGSPILHFKGVKIPLRFIMSNFQQNFRQPFNQFGISPNWGKMKLYLGHNRLSWSKYTLNGHRFLGGGVDWNPGILRVGAMAGQFVKAVEQDTSIKISESLSKVPRPAFNRNGYAFKIGIGKEKNYLDLIYFKGKDQLSSLNEIPILSNVLPAENASLGLNANFNLKAGFYLKVDIGVSGFTRDQNATLIAIAETKYQSLLNNVLVPRNSTQVFGAGEINLGFKSKSFGIDFKMQRIDPGYRTMGAYYYQSDIKRTLLGFFTQDKKRKIRIKASLGLQEDNLLNHKLFKTKRKIGNLNVVFTPSKIFGCNIQYANFGTAQEAGLRSISDTTRLDNIVSSLVINPMLNFTSSLFNHSINMIWSNQNLNDENRFTSTFTEIQSNNINLNYNLQVIKSGIGLTAGWNKSVAQISAGETISQGISVGINTALMKNKLNIAANYTANNNQFERIDNGKTNRLNFNLSFRANAIHSFRLNYFILKNKSLNSLASQSFRERTARLIYTHRFTSNQKSKQ